MGRDSLDRMKEKAPESTLTGFLQIKGYSCTSVREAIAAVFGPGLKAYSVSELSKITGFPRMTLYRNLNLLTEQRLIHFSPSINSYFACQKPAKSKGRLSSTCHSFAICEKCKHVEEFVHVKHAHPRTRRVGNLKADHEWLGLCSSCDRL